MSPEHIAPNLERIRKAAGMTRTEMADAIGISRQFLTQLETGEKWPSVERLCDICEVLDVDPLVLLCEVN